MFAIPLRDSYPKDALNNSLIIVWTETLRQLSSLKVARCPFVKQTSFLSKAPESPWWMLTMPKAIPRRTLRLLAK